MSKSKRDANKSHRNPIKVAMDLRYGKQVTTHRSGERRPKDQRAKNREMHED
jgi:hypothetical protein